MISGSIAVLLSMTYLLGFALYLRRPRETGALMPLTLPPLLLMSFAAWLACAHHAQTGDTSAAWPLRWGGVVTFLAALLPIALERDVDAISHRRPPIVVPALCWLTSLGALATALRRPTGFAAWNVSLVGAFLSLALVVAVAVTAANANRYAVSRRNQLAALGITGVLAAIQAAVAWYFI